MFKKTHLVAIENPSDFFDWERGMKGWVQAEWAGIEPQNGQGPAAGAFKRSGRPHLGGRDGDLEGGRRSFRTRVCFLG